MEKENNNGLEAIDFFIYGRQPIIESLRSNHKPVKIWMAPGLEGYGVHAIVKLAERNAVPIETVAKNDIQKKVGPVVHQGVAAQLNYNPFISKSQFSEIIESKENPLILVLDQVQDPHNLGAILRTAEITGVDVIVLPQKGTAQINATVAKTSAGALFNTWLFQEENIANLFGELQDRGIRIFATLPNAEKNIYQTDFRTGMALIIGSEGKGVRKNLVPFCDGAVSIPQYGKVNSLNASVSAAVVLFEVIRQRNFRQ